MQRNNAYSLDDDLDRTRRFILGHHDISPSVSSDASGWCWRRSSECSTFFINAHASIGSVSSFRRCARVLYDRALTRHNVASLRAAREEVRIVLRPGSGPGRPEAPADDIRRADTAVVGRALRA